ncbi:MAG TPA: IPT/TIG domain-containing protein [Opitutaceae bacterium]|nr:IPT/TIG domain-containing protein [Opitutaceae bacterium]
MQKNRSFHARRIFLCLGASIVLGLAGCQGPSITNLTPDALAENPSQIYTISARILPKDSRYVAGTVNPKIVINGQGYKMNKSPLGENIYEFDYQVPAGATEVKYYFLVNYMAEENNMMVAREDYSQLFTAKIAGRYVLSLEVNRGPVGARISILGRGFNANDTVYFDGTPVRTIFESPNAISFYVPSVEPSRNYKVSLGSESSQTPVGTFRVDALGNAEAPITAGSAPVVPTGPTNNSFVSSPVSGALSVSPTGLVLSQGEKRQLTFTSPVTAGAGGILIDVTTDVPESVIMPEVVVPQGSNSVTVTVEGGRPGIGSLFAKGPGVRELTIPISVK